jgi:uncharacterized protein (DUF58 family)
MVNPQDTLSFLLSNGVHCGLSELVRYRALAQKLNLAPTRSVNSSMSGALTSRFKGRGMEFDEARHYQPGDDIRSIDWRVTARTGKTHTKLYREERERAVLIFVDFSASMHFGTQLLYKSVQALHAAALITFSALSRGDKIGCMAVAGDNDIERKPKSTTKHALSMLNQLIDLQNSAVNQAFSEQQVTQHSVDNTSNKIDTRTHQMNQLAMLARPGTLVYVISDFHQFSERAFSVLGKINRHCEVRPLRIFDPIEEALPAVNSMQDVLVSNGEQEQHILLGDNKVNEEYKNLRSGVFNALKANLLTAGLPLRQISAAFPAEQQLSASKSGLILGEFV